MPTKITVDNRAESADDDGEKSTTTQFHSTLLWRTLMVGMILFAAIILIEQNTGTTATHHLSGEDSSTMLADTMRKSELLYFSESTASVDFKVLNGHTLFEVSRLRLIINVYIVVISTSC